MQSLKAKTSDRICPQSLASTKTASKRQREQTKNNTQFNAYLPAMWLRGIMHIFLIIALHNPASKGPIKFVTVSILTRQQRGNMNTNQNMALGPQN